VSDQPTDPPPGSEWTETDGELTLRGEETADELGHGDVVIEQTHRHNVQNRALLGLMILVVEVLLLAVTSLIGVAAGWFPDDFALKFLALTLTPSFGAWVIVLRWAFQRVQRA
jgi:hypothetical protein